MMVNTKRVPAGAVDTHCHIFDPARFPFDPCRSYTPRTAIVGELQAIHARLGISRVVLVQPSVYGTDNKCLLQSLATLANARGVAVIDPAAVTDEGLDALRKVGVVGVRVNLGASVEGQAEIAREAVSRTVARVAPFGLLVQLYIDLPLVAVLADVISASPVPIVLDHLGGARANYGVEQPGFGVLLALLADDKAWVKLSASHRTARDESDYPSLKPIIQSLIGANPHRLIWGSDWPHTGGTARNGPKPGDVEPFRTVDDASILMQLSSWVLNAGTRQAIFVDNPTRLFSF